MLTKKQGLLVIVLIISFSFIPLIQLQADDESINVVETMKGIDGTHHIEVIPRTFQNQEIPYMEQVELAITDNETKETKIYELHPMFGKFFHYGDNFKLEKKIYTLKFTLHPPTFSRDSFSQNKWIEHITTEFQFDASKEIPDAGLSIGEKETEDMTISFMAFQSKNMFAIEHSGDEHTDNEGDTHMTSTSKVPSGSNFSVSDAAFIVIGLLGGVALGVVIPKVSSGKKS